MISWNTCLEKSWNFIAAWSIETLYKASIQLVMVPSHHREKQKKNGMAIFYWTSIFERYQNGMTADLYILKIQCITAPLTILQMPTHHRWLDHGTQLIGMHFNLFILCLFTVTEASKGCMVTIQISSADLSLLVPGSRHTETTTWPVPFNHFNCMPDVLGISLLSWPNPLIYFPESLPT